MALTIGVLALQGGFAEHLDLLQKAAVHLKTSGTTPPDLDFTEVRDTVQLNRCDALVVPGGESTSMSIVAARTGLLEPLRDFVK